MALDGAPETSAKPFDGIICIGGEDWWYHNRGHFDFQIMRRLAEHWPVLFVNSLGVRMPSPAEGSKFLARIGRKARSLARGLSQVENEFYVFSPLSVPGQVGQAVSGWALAPQIKLAARRIGIRRPLLWVHCPAGAPLVERIPAAAVIMQRTDRFEAFPEADPHVVGRQIAYLKSRADLVVYCAPHLEAEERSKVRRSLLLTHGADVAAFSAAGQAAANDPADVADIPRPRVGFVGGIDAHTFDPELFLDTAKRLPDVSFLMVGGVSLPTGWCTLPNVHFLGRKPYDEVAAYMAASNVLIMPWNQSEWIRACNPIKLKEYLATGRPVVTTDFPALDGWRDLVQVAEGPDAFSDAIRRALRTELDHRAVLGRLALETWGAKAELLRRAIEGLGLRYRNDAMTGDSARRKVG
ncbi:MAG: glycosyltransferase [Proteobacteria bacterium]|nr:glycosyltransferase [Pseudomonadota bacterium]